MLRVHALPRPRLLLLFLLHSPSLYLANDGIWGKDAGDEGDLTGDVAAMMMSTGCFAEQWGHLHGKRRGAGLIGWLA